MRNRIWNVALLVCSAWFGLSACGGTEEDDAVVAQDMQVVTPGGDMGSVMCLPSCAQGATCVNGMCMTSGVTPDMGTTPVVPTGASVGAACTMGGDCATELCLADDDIPGGYCSKICGTGLPGADDRCPTASLCVQIADAASACLTACSQDAECRNGYVCESVGAQGSVCLPACASDLDCEYGDICGADGRCVLDDSGTNRIGSSCEFDEECAGEVCFDEDSTGWPGGTCAADCTGRSDGEFCDGVSANSGLCLVFDDGEGLCLPSCSTTTDCRNGYICSVDEGDSNDQGYGFCLPSCDFLDCAEGDVCDVSGTCVEDIFIAQRITTSTLGTFAVTDEDFASVVFDIPDDALSFGLTFDSDNRIEGVSTVIQLLGPNGNVIYDAFNPIASSMKFFDGEGSPTSFIYPNAPSLNLTPGQYTLEFAAYAPANVKVDLHIKSGSEPVLETLPMTFWFLGNSYYSASTAETDPFFQLAVAEMTSIYANAGISLDPIVYRDADEEVALAYSAFDIELTSISEVILETLGQDRSPGAHMVFNDQLFLGDGGVLYGVSAGLPGPPSLNDTATLGVFVALDVHVTDEGLDSTELGATMAHELGHYLGLFHISEADGTSHDPLSDTAECYDSDDTDGSGSLDGDECGGAAATNMMFWTSAENFTQDQISPAQSWVLHRNPAMFE